MSGPKRVPPAVQDSENVPVVELARYLEQRLLQEAAEDATQARQQGVSEVPGQRSRNIAITYFQTAILWLKDSVEGQQNAHGPRIQRS